MTFQNRLIATPFEIAKRIVDLSVSCNRWGNDMRPRVLAAVVSGNIQSLNGHLSGQDYVNPAAIADLRRLAGQFAVWFLFTYNGAVIDTAPLFSSPI